MKTCNGCRALYGINLNQMCNLGYKLRIEEVRRSWGKLQQAVPDEKCPKPKTWDAWLNANRAIK
jgi:hypothetical protein